METIKEGKSTISLEKKTSSSSINDAQLRELLVALKTARKGDFSIRIKA